MAIISSSKRSMACSQICCRAAVSGLGLVYVPDFAVAQEINNGTLIGVLEDAISGGQFALLWPGNRHLLPKLRVFIDFITQHHPLGA